MPAFFKELDGLVEIDFAALEVFDDRLKTGDLGFERFAFFAGHHAGRSTQSCAVPSDGALPVTPSALAIAAHAGDACFERALHETRMDRVAQAHIRAIGYNFPVGRRQQRASARKKFVGIGQLEPVVQTL